MQPTRLALLVTKGQPAGEWYDFGQRMRCLIGRAEDCDVQLAIEGVHSDISRHHCELEFTPPDLWLRDLGSRNGTFLNGKRIGQRFNGQPIEDVDLRQFPAYGLHDGDEIRVGHTILRVSLIGDDEESESEQPMEAGSYHEI